MLNTKKLQGECQYCGGAMEFDAEHVGSTADCPHCGQPTELLLATPPEEESPVPKKAIVFAILATLILGGGLFAANIALKRAKRFQAQRQQSVEMPAVKAPPDAFAAQGFRVSPVTLERESGSSMVYAVGTISDTSNRQRFGLRVELELLGEDGLKVGEANDYQKLLEPKAEWRFRALAVASSPLKKSIA